MGYEYAEVYVDAARAPLAPVIAGRLGFRPDDGSVAPALTDGVFEVEFRTNKDAQQPPANFLAYRTVIEVASADGSERHEIVPLVDRILAALAREGHVAVPSADFEPELTPPPAPAQVTYYAKVDEKHPRLDPRGLVRRRVVDGIAHDEAFTRNLKWEPTEYLKRHALGHNDVDHIQITPQEAEDFITRITRKLGNRRGSALDGDDEPASSVDFRGGAVWTTRSRDERG